jgi:hypothetical protein
MGAAEQFLLITPFSAISTCENFVWEYSGVNSKDGHVLNYSVDLMSVNNTSGEIRVA